MRRVSPDSGRDQLIHLPASSSVVAVKLIGRFLPSQSPTSPKSRHVTDHRTRHQFAEDAQIDE